MSKQIDKQIKRDFAQWADGHEIDDEISTRLTRAVRWVAWIAWQAAAKKYTQDYGKREDVQGQKKMEFDDGE